MTEKILDMGLVSTKNQITLPKAVRERFSIKVGDRLLFVEEDGKLILRKG